jgi:hypothetical protein
MWIVRTCDFEAEEEEGVLETLNVIYFTCTARCIHPATVNETIEFPFQNTFGGLGASPSAGCSSSSPSAGFCTS